MRTIGFAAELEHDVWLGRGANRKERVTVPERVCVFPTVEKIVGVLAERADLATQGVEPLIHPVLLGDPVPISQAEDKPESPVPDETGGLLGRLYRDPNGKVWRLELRGVGCARGGAYVPLVLRRRDRRGRWGKTREGIGPDRVRQLRENDQIVTHDGKVRFQRIPDDS